MTKHPNPDDQPVRSGSEFDELMFPRLAREDLLSGRDLDPEELGTRVAREAIERLRTGAPRPEVSSTTLTRVVERVEV